MAETCVKWLQLHSLLSTYVDYKRQKLNLYASKSEREEKQFSDTYRHVLHVCQHDALINIRIFIFISTQHAKPLLILKMSVVLKFALDFLQGV